MLCHRNRGETERNKERMEMGKLITNVGQVSPGGFQSFELRRHKEGEYWISFGVIFRKIKQTHFGDTESSFCVEGRGETV